MKPTDEEIKRRLSSEQHAMGRVTNNDMVCKDCVFRMDDSVIYGNSSRCQVVGLKPADVIMGGSCEDYVMDPDLKKK